MLIHCVLVCNVTVHVICSQDDKYEVETVVLEKVCLYVGLCLSVCLCMCDYRNSSEDVHGVKVSIYLGHIWTGI